MKANLQIKQEDLKVLFSHTKNAYGNKSQLHFQTENRLELNEYIQTLIIIEKKYE